MKKTKIKLTLQKHRKDVEKLLTWLKKLPGRKGRHGRVPARSPRETEPLNLSEYKEADLLFMKGDYEKALLLYDRALSVNSEDPRIYEARGNTLMTLKRYDEALDTFTHGNEILNNNSEYCWLGIGRALYNLGDLRRAGLAFESGLESCVDRMRSYLDRMNSETYNEDFKRTLASLFEWLGYIEYDLRNYPGAIRYFGRVSEINPRLISPYYYTAKSAIHLKEPYFAIERLTHGLRISREEKDTPYIALIHLQLGVAYQTLNEYEQARTNYETAIELDNREPTFHSYLGDFLLLQGKTEEAIEHYRIACALDPTNDAAGKDLQSALKTLDRLRPQEENDWMNCGESQKDWRDDEHWPEVIDERGRAE